MDYMGILKRAWNVTWRHKVLWIFGFLAGSSSGSARSGTDYSSSSNNDVSPQLQQLGSSLEHWASENIALIAVVVGLMAIVAIVFWVLSVMAQGALVHQVNEAEEDRPVSLSAGFSAGFRYWGRVFLIQLALGLPLVVLVLVLVAGIILAIVPLARSDGGGEALAALPLLCGGGVVGFLVLFVGAFLIGLLLVLGLRYAVLEERTAFDAIGAAWGAVRSRFKDVLVMWLLMLVVGSVYGIATGLVMLMLIVPGVLMLVTGNVFGFIGLVVLAGLLMVVPNAVFGTFHSAAWTVFFRRMTGREALPVPAVPVPPVPPAYAPPPPPAPPAPASEERPVYPIAGPEGPPEAPPAPRQPDATEPDA